MTKQQIAAVRRDDYRRYREDHDTDEARQQRAAERERYWARRDREAHKISMLMRGMF